MIININIIFFYKKKYFIYLYNIFIDILILKKYKTICIFLKNFKVNIFKKYFFFKLCLNYHLSFNPLILEILEETSSKSHSFFSSVLITEAISELT